MPIAELFLSSVVKTLLNQLASGLLAEYARINGISDKLNNWNKRLLMIQAVMDSAEERQMDGDPAVNHWLADLRDVAYDMEDLLDEFTVEAKRNASKAQARSAKLPSCLIACCSRINPRTLLSDHRMADEIEEVDRRLEEGMRQKDLLKLVENPRRRFPANSNQPRFATTSLPEPKFVGRKKQMDELLNRLTGIEAIEDFVRPFTVVSIVGMGGLGKTTLAQELYNHESISKVFAVRAWTCVSDVFDKVSITKSVLDQVAPSSPSEGKDLNWLQNSLKEQLSGKKFLIVVDDVWNENYEELESLLKPFYSGSRGSRILLTTRNKEVAKSVRDRDPTLLSFLSSNECLSLLAYHAIGKESFENLPHLQDIAVKLAAKCKGLPLAAKTIGGLLCFESSDQKWTEVLDHGIWKRESENERIPPALKLSYIHLPIHLKRCFAACALFPKDYLFDRDELIQMWIVQGLVDKGTAKTYQDAGMDCLRQLEGRSLLQKVSDEKTRYSMHDLVNDLAKSVVGATYFSSDEYRGTCSDEALAKVRHAAMVTQLYDRCVASRVKVYHSMKKLRTFMPFQISIESYSNVWVSNKVIHDLIMFLKKLRMLSFRNFRISKVPDKIGELKLLRSIDFSYTDVEVLPESICELVELQSLLLRGCRYLEKLPRNIHKLTNLLQLDITGADHLEEMPPHVGDLTDLEILSDFMVGKEAGRELKELGPLKCLQRDLHIRNLQEVTNIRDAGIANLKDKEGIFEFSFDWGSEVGTSHDDEKLLDHLEPPSKIELIAIHRYGGKKLSSWFGKPCMNNVVRITLAGCKSVESLPSFGQLPSLERLCIEGLDAVSTIGAEFYGMETPFRSLRYLSFQDMTAWEKWSSHEDCESNQPFPRLYELTMSNCRKLKRGLPGRLHSLFKLEINYCPFLETSGDTLSLPSLGEMHVESCNEGLLKCMVDLTSMTKVTILKVSQLVHFDESFTTSWVALEEIRIEGCPRSTPFVDGDGRKQVPPELKKLVIRGCGDVEKLPDDLYQLTSLNELIVFSCEKLSSFPSMGLPPALRTVVLIDCPSLPQSQLISTRLPESLEQLFLNDLTGLVSLAGLIEGSRLSRSLRRLTIDGCRSLTTLPGSLQNLSSLSELTVYACEALEIDCFPALPCNLSSFELSSCPRVKSLPQDMHNLASLKELRIMFCEGITCLPRRGLPPNLGLLNINKCRKLNQPLEAWGLSVLTRLEVLIIGGEMECLDEMVCFPSSSANDHDAWLRCLPSSLVRLEIHRMKKLERLAGGLRTRLTPLQELVMQNCERLRQLPGDGLPDSLEWLDIEGCPLLGERCREPNGDYWPLLQLIPGLLIM